MLRSELYIRPHSRIALTAYSLASVAMALAALAVWCGGCTKDSAPAPAVDQKASPQTESPGAEFLIGLLDELSAIAGAGTHEPVGSTAARHPGFPNGMSGNPGKLVIASAATDSTFVYGEVTPDGFGAVVTERHQYPKGLLLITVRKTHGIPQGGIVSETRKYISFEDLRG